MAGQVSVGLLGVGLKTYWGQFPGLKDRLLGYVDAIATALSRPDVKVVSAGIVDTVDAAIWAGKQFRTEDVELLFVYAATYALSATVLPVVSRLRVPVIVLNLQPAGAIDYESFNQLPDRTAMTQEWLAHCGACTVPEILNVLKRAQVDCFQVTGTLRNDPHVAAEIDAWLSAARAAHVMRHNRLGLLGRHYNGMLDTYTDQVLQLATFGGHMEILEIDELAQLAAAATGKIIDERIALFESHFDIQPDCAAAELRRAAITSLALDALVEKHRLGSLAYYYESVPGHPHEDLISSVILGSSLLTARGIPVAGEYEIKNVQAMKIMDALGAGGSFTEYYAVDFADDVVLMGHDGPGHIAIAEGKTKVKPLRLYHGKPGHGLSVEMSVRHGPVTLLSVVEQRSGRLALLYAEGASVQGPILEIGNTNSRYRFPLQVRQFVESWNSHGPAHHCAIGVGHMGATLKRLGAILGIETLRVC